jgi:hypothetical protein
MTIKIGLVISEARIVVGACSSSQRELCYNFG